MSDAPYGYVVELYGSSGHLIHISRCQPYRPIAEACAKDWQKSYGDKWSCVIVPLFKTSPETREVEND